MHMQHIGYRCEKWNWCAEFKFEARTLRSPSHKYSWEKGMNPPLLLLLPSYGLSSRTDLPLQPQLETALGEGQLSIKNWLNMNIAIQPRKNLLTTETTVVAPSIARLWAYFILGWGVDTKEVETFICHFNINRSRQVRLFSRSRSSSVF